MAKWKAWGSSHQNNTIARLLIITPPVLQPPPYSLSHYLSPEQSYQLVRWQYWWLPRPPSCKGDLKGAQLPRWRAGWTCAVPSRHSTQHSGVSSTAPTRTITTINPFFRELGFYPCNSFLPSCFCHTPFFLYKNVISYKFSSYRMPKSCKFFHLF